jgi:tetratricopeptide (TPR) repeat protein
MKKNFKKIELLYLIFFIFSFSLANYFHTNYKKKALTIDKQESAITVKEDLLLLFSLGQNRLFADLLWITTLLESDLKHYKKRDYNSWMYLRFLSIARLDPLFLRNYQFGGKYLSIVKDDLIGARDIFERGLEQYPEDYDLLFNGAFLYAFELGDFKNGLKLYEKLLEINKAPEFIKSLIPKLKFQTTGDLSLTYQVLKETLKTAEPGSTLYNKLNRDIYALKAQIDLDCLNNGKDNCSRYDEDGNPYLLKGNEYIAPKEFEKYQLHNPNKKKEE